MWTYAFLFSSLMVDGDTLLPHSASVISSTRRTDPQYDRARCHDRPLCGRYRPGLSPPAVTTTATSCPSATTTKAPPLGRAGDGPWDLRKEVRQPLRQSPDAIKIWSSGGGIWRWDNKTDPHYTFEEILLGVLSRSVGRPHLYFSKGSFFTITNTSLLLNHSPSEWFSAHKNLPAEPT